MNPEITNFLFQTLGVLMILSGVIIFIFANRGEKIPAMWMITLAAIFIAIGLCLLVSDYKAA